MPYPLLSLGVRRMADEVLCDAFMRSDYDLIGLCRNNK